MAEALVGLGGNFGDVGATLDQAVTAFCDGTDVRLVAQSSDYLTAPRGVVARVDTRGVERLAAMR